MLLFFPNGMVGRNRVLTRFSVRLLGSGVVVFYYFGPVLWSPGLSERHQDDCKDEYGCLNKDDISEFREFEFSAAGSAGPHIRVPLGVCSLFW